MSKHSRMDKAINLYLALVFTGCVLCMWFGCVAAVLYGPVALKTLCVVLLPFLGLMTGVVEEFWEDVFDEA